MTSNVGTKNFSSYADNNSEGFNDLDQLAQDTNIVKVERDEVSSLEKVVLNSGPFAFNFTSYINDTVKDCLFVNSPSIVQYVEITLPRSSGIFAEQSFA